MTMDEIELPWSLVVESDEIYSPKTKRWHPIAQVGITPEGRVKFRVTGMGKFAERDPREKVKVRRGPTGVAVDVLQIIFSGPTVPERVGTTGGLGATMDDHRKDEDE